ncbi:MAG: TPM domain-containing protein, partial [Bacillota bacterium]|nr:TPM domain-containing protein [Bacillota bacterium]
GDNIQDAKALAQAISSILQGLESFVQGGGVADSIWSPVSGFVFEDSSEAVESTENEVAAESEAPGAPTVEVSVAADEDPQLDNVTDAAGLLTDEEWQKLEQKARDISVAHDFGVYIITVDDYKEYSDGRILDACKTIYDDYNLGMGEDRDGVVLMLSMRDRDYTLMCDGSFGNYAFTDAGREDLTEFFLDNFSDDDWYGGFDDYLDAADDFLVNAEEGNPYSEDHPAMSSSDRILGIAIRVAIILLVPLIIAFIWVAVLTSKMKSVAAAVEASTYVSGQLHLNQSYEHYTYSTETRTKIESSSGGGSSSGSSGSASGTSGKF